MSEIKTVFDPIAKEENADMDVLHPEEIKALDDKCDELARKYSVSKVRAVVFIHPETKERAVAFLKEPSYLVKIRIMDKAGIIGVYSAADELREAIILKEESDPKTYGETPDCDEYKLGVAEECIKIIKKLNNQFKKK